MFPGVRERQGWNEVTNSGHDDLEWARTQSSSGKNPGASELLVPSDPVAGPDGGSAAAIRTIRLLAAGIFVALVGTVVYVTARLVAPDSPPARGTPVLSPAAVAPLAPDGRFREAGPLQGVDLAAYFRDRSTELVEAEGTRLAIVSLRSYAKEAEARRAVDGVDIEALLVAAPGGTPSVVRTSLVTWANDQRSRDEEELAEIRRLLPTVEDAAFKADYEAEAARLKTAIEAVDPSSDVVFGLVVSGPADALKRLALTRSIRIVDLAPEGDADDEAIYRGVRPEEMVKANVPPTRTITGN